MAYFLAQLAAYIIWFLASLIMVVPGDKIDPGVVIFVIVAGFFVGASICGMMIKSPKLGPIGFNKACLVSLALLLIGAIFATGIGLVIFLIRLFLF